MLSCIDFFNMIFQKLKDIFYFSNGTVVSAAFCAWILLIFVVLLFSNGFYAKAIKGFRAARKFLKRNYEINVNNIVRFEKKCINKFPKRFRLAWKNFTLLRNEKNIVDFFNIEVIPALKFEHKEKKAYATFDLTVLLVLICGGWIYLQLDLSLSSKLLCVFAPIVFFGILRWCLVYLFCARQNRIVRELSDFRDKISCRMIFEKHDDDEFFDISEEYNKLLPQKKLNSREPSKLNALLNKVDEMLCCNVSQNTLKRVANMIISVRDKDYTTDEEKAKLNAALGKICSKIA